MIEPQFDAELGHGAHWGPWFAIAHDPTDREFGEFSEGLAAVRRGKTFAYVDKSGKTVFEIKDMKDAEEFSGGLALVKTTGGVGLNGSVGVSTYGFVDRTGTFVVKPQFVGARSFREGLAAVMAKDKKCYFIDKAGAVAIEGAIVDGKKMEFTEPRSFSEGVASVAVGEAPAKFAFIDKRGNAVIKPQFTTCSGFSGGLAPVCSVHTLLIQSWAKYGFVDKTGKMVIQQTFDEAHPFMAGGLAEVTFIGRRAGSLGGVATRELRTDWIDQTGKIVCKGLPMTY